MTSSKNLDLVARRTRAFLFFALVLSAYGAPQANAQISAESDKLLHRMYDSPDFQVKYFGPAKWLDDGAGFTTVEPSASVQNAQDIVRYDTASGTRDVLVSASKLIPKGAKTPLELQGYSWTNDRSRLLIYTNSKQVWRQNTRGDYWILELATGKLHKLGGDAPESSLMFAKFSPDGTRAAYVRANNIYLEDVASEKITQLTSDGSESIINGTSDWVYEEEFFLRDGFRCAYCGKSIEEGARLTIDHLLPCELGGTNDTTNLITACLSCNSAKQDLPLQAWLSVLRDRGVNTDGMAVRIRRTVARPLDRAEGRRLAAAA